MSVEAPSGKGKGDENFPVGSRLIRAELRPHVHAFYDFARNADDIADDPTIAAPRRRLRRLDLMGVVLIGDAEDGSPSASGLRDSLEQTGVSPQHALDLLQAFRQDAVKTRYADLGRADGLLPVLRHAGRPPRAGPAWGAARDTYPPSDALCSALQVLNHLQDCAQDLSTLDRCYIPQDMLAAAGIRRGGRAANPRPGRRCGPCWTRCWSSRRTR